MIVLVVFGGVVRWKEVIIVLKLIVLWLESDENIFFKIENLYLLWFDKEEELGKNAQLFMMIGGGLDIFGNEVQELQI